MLFTYYSISDADSTAKLLRSGKSVRLIMPLLNYYNILIIDFLSVIETGQKK